LKSIVQTSLIAAGLVGLAACGSGMTGTTTPQTPSADGSSTTMQNAGIPSLPFARAGTLQRACPMSFNPDVMQCDVLIDMSVAPNRDRPDVSGHGPADFQSAYNLPSSTGGSGQTVAVVDAYDNTTAETDLATYRSYFGLPACTSSSGCFQKLNQAGQPGPYPPANSGWAVEEALDIEMVSAVCPNCHIILMEANSNSTQNLGRTVDRAIKVGANVVSNSYGAFGGATRSPAARYYDHKHHIITVSAGDGGYGTAVPAAFSTVVAVGGTILVKNPSSPRGWNETVWPGTGSGCAWRVTKPAWQTDKQCTGRTMNDVAAVGTATAIYHGSSWGQVAGTSISSPLVAGIYGLAGNAKDLDEAQSLYQNASALNDITSGSNGTCRKTYLCTAGTGYDGPSGNGTADGLAAF
jgi:hypothetical protein